MKSTLEVIVALMVTAYGQALYFSQQHLLQLQLPLLSNPFQLLDQIELWLI